MLPLWFYTYVALTDVKLVNDSTIGLCNRELERNNIIFQSLQKECVRADCRQLS